ncbi:hypothetical protein GALMADRAFT_62843 [Galerina marginata CBS 339.88]|uniref:GH16 domain-containing protein n=1 Tax=Galerina marginata (strain CBS 339.88) TaxID=685588 RepID=A0A067TCG3_GALM3|nr:hypothetical protein GALMADRAFT_62843 [Galerina marginata CBS 339.88]
MHPYDLVKDYSGDAFFNDWDFYGNYDNLTWGDVNWLDRTNATDKKLAFTNDVGNAILKVDNSTDVAWGDKRDSIRITTKAAYGLGTIWIADIVHLPFGCSVWPALWTKGPTWPQDGEIDIVEAINMMQSNQMALHTSPGCKHTPTTQLGTSVELDCSTPAGCTVIENAPNSFGEGFNSAGGGVFATRFDASGIWFWGRNEVPKSIASEISTTIMSTDDWGIPSANYSSGPDCDMPTYFSAQNIVLDITLCGGWAGNPDIYTPQCGAQGPTGKCYDDNVVGEGSAKKYDDAYFEIKYLRAYTDGQATVVTNRAVPPVGSTKESGTDTTLTRTVADSEKSRATDLQSFASLVWTSVATMVGLMAVFIL